MRSEQEIPGVEIKIDPEFQSLIPPLSSDEYRDLENSILREGCRDPIVVWQEEQILIDGHNRFSICSKHGLPFQTVEQSFSSRLEVQEWMIFNQLSRRNLTIVDRCRVGERALDIERQRAQERMLAGKSTSSKIGEATQLAAEQVGIGRNTLKRWLYIKVHATEDDLKRLQDGQYSIKSLESKLRRAQRDETYKQARTDRLDRAELATLQIRSSGDSASSVGQWWQLGRHFLYCGDSSSDEFRQFIPSSMPFGFADPPYKIGNVLFDEGFEWKHDYMTDVCDYVWITPGISGMPSFCNFTTMRYHWTVVVYKKNAQTKSPIGFSNWIPILLFTNREKPWIPMRDLLEISLNRSNKDGDFHPTRKPYELVSWLMEYTSAAGDYVMDPFLGSGTTLIVAEDLGRVCYGAEINPEYCNNIIDWWQEKTGQRATLLP